MKPVTNLLVAFGFFVGLLWLAGTLGIGDFNLTYGPSRTPVKLTCLEFASTGDQSLFNSTGIIRTGASLSTKARNNCKGVFIADAPMSHQSGK